MSAYFDYNATTMVDEEVMAAMQPYWRDCYANAASHHAAGRQARQAVENAREQVAAALDAHPAEVVFTSSGTESNNTIIKGVAKMAIKNAVAVSAVEHPCILCATRSLHGAAVPLFLAVDSNGRLDMDDLDDTLKNNDCALVSVMTANNETGVLQDVAQIAERVHAAGAFFHTDAAQAVGKIPLSFAASGADAMTLSGHKFYAPKGIAALIVRRQVPFAPLLEGGGHQDGRRSGTENVPGIVGLGRACELAAARVEERMTQFSNWRDKLEQRLTAAGAVIFGAQVPRLPNTCYFGFPSIDGDTMVTMLDQSGFAVTSGAACASMKDAPSHVLLAMEVPEAIARTAVRFSLGADSTEAQVSAFADCAITLAKQLQQLSAVAVED
ncbi:MAG: cysteine desulfurase [Proteobacteria bacterium]|nr:cysteine desulfurase [Pseudomonadota bacterium]